MLNTNKLQEVAVLRSFAIILVVLNHSFAPYTTIMGWNPFYIDHQNVALASFFKIWISGRMPLYIFISGYLFSYLLNFRGKYGSTKDFIKKKFHRLIIPFCIFSVLIGITMKDYDLKNYIYTYASHTHLWFILMLFWCFLCAYTLKKIKSLFLQMIILGISFIARIYIKDIELPFCLDDLLRYFMWFWLGYIIMFNREKLIWIFKWQFILFFFIAWVTLAIYNQFVLKYGTFLHLFFILTILTFTKKLLDNHIMVVKPWLDRFNECTFGIYIFHNWFIMFLFNSPYFFYRSQFLQFGHFHPWITPLLIFTLSLFISYMITLLLRSKTRFGKSLL